MTQSKGKKRGVSAPPQASARAADGAAGSGARQLQVAAELAGQRLDNFLMRELKGLPRSRVYSMLRKGEVRVNRGRAKPSRRLEAGDLVRIPPMHLLERAAIVPPSTSLSARLQAGTVFEDADVLVVDKPAGLAVHGGSGVRTGMVEALRSLRPDLPYLELVHRIDRDTSGCVVLAKRRSVLRKLHAVLRQREANKRYLALVAGDWPSNLTQLDAPLERRLAPSGERFVRVSRDGKTALTRVRVLQRLAGATLLEARPETGRTHQIRVHLAAAAHPILGDPKYADDDALARQKALGVTRLCLHAAAIELPDWADGGVGWRCFEVPLASDMRRWVEALQGTD